MARNGSPWGAKPREMSGVRQMVVSHLDHVEVQQMLSRIAENHQKERLCACVFIE